ncbi:GNAT family N-acetyltransferase [Streptomyces yaizuensis]|uniref:GNAT family N-acetyltransferase n=1 Tax=Streptomyces yaizuensis TaxID=2989713 RepID=A0ABQ5P946_9ACTN|nr:GNAT family N-acetyltransferase [Streptomyces sp. YSPA8]GLF99106.1 GNAT family N-acetyltransferase [Streptomyces sp. YSPA8]
MIETERLTLRPFRPEDADRFVALHADDRVNAFVGTYTLETARDRLRLSERQWAERGHGILAVHRRSDDAFLGRCGLTHWEAFGETEIGWTLSAESWGHGYATEAARACLDWAFGAGALGVPYITAMIHPGNTASARVAARLGFSRLRDDTLMDRGVTVYALHALDRPAADAAGTAGTAGA